MTGWIILIISSSGGLFSSADFRVEHVTEAQCRYLMTQFSFADCVAPDGAVFSTAKMCGLRGKTSLNGKCS